MSRADGVCSTTPAANLAALVRFEGLHDFGDVLGVLYGDVRRSHDVDAPAVVAPVLLRSFFLDTSAAF